MKQLKNSAALILIATAALSAVHYSPLLLWSMAGGTILYLLGAVPWQNLGPYLLAVILIAAPFYLRFPWPGSLPHLFRLGLTLIIWTGLLAFVVGWQRRRSAAAKEPADSQKSLSE